VAVVGALVLWAHPLVIHHAFEARFYAPLMAATALVAWSLGVPGRRGQVLLAVFSILLCTLHYFGVLVLILLIGGAIGSGRRSRRNLWAAAFGPLAMLACLPILLQQRAALPHKTWLSDLDSAAVWQFAKELTCLPVLLVFVAAYVVGRFTKMRGIRISLFAPLLALLAMPLLLLLISVTVQPVMLARY